MMMCALSSTAAALRGTGTPKSRLQEQQNLLRTEREWRVELLQQQAEQPVRGFATRPAAPDVLPPRCMHGLAARALHPIIVLQRKGALAYCSRAARALQAERTTCVQQVSTGRQCGEGGRSMKLGTGQAGGSSGVVGNVAMAKDGMQTDDIFRGCQAMLVGLRSLVLVASWRPLAGLCWREPSLL